MDLAIQDVLSIGPVSMLDIQNLRHYPDLLNQNLYFNKILRSSALGHLRGKGMQSPGLFFNLSPRG